MTVEIVRGLPGVAAEISGSSDLMAELDAPVTARATWLTTALASLPAGRPVAVVSRSGSGTRTGAAFLTVTRRRGFAAVGLVGEGVSDHARLLAVDDVAAGEVAEGILSVLRDIRGPWRLYLEQVPHGDPVLAHLAASVRHRVLSDGDVCPVTRIGEGRELAAYLSRNGRGTVKQGRNRLTRVDPDWAVERTRDPAEIAAALPTAVALHRQRDRAQGRRSDLDDPRRVDFFTTVTRALAEEGRIELATLRVGGEVAAYFVVLLDGAVHRLWDGRISMAHSHLRAGRVLDVALLTAALEDPAVVAVDWMRGDLEHKRQAANDAVRTQKLVGWSSAALRTSERSARWARERIRAVAPTGAGGERFPHDEDAPADGHESVAGRPAAASASPRRARVDLPSAPPGRAVILGDRDLGAPLHAAGVPVTAVVHPRAVSRFSRHYDAWLPDPEDDDALVALLLKHASEAAGPVALFYQSDDQMLLVSRRRKELGAHLRFVLPEPDLLEALVDKAAFADLAERLGLPVPPTRVLPVTGGAGDPGLGFPVLVKPLRREDAWGEAVPGKAAMVADRDELCALLDALAAGHSHVLAQQLVPGPETRIESYHAYVDATGAVVAEFTGRKIRTLPAEFGHTTAVITTDAEDVRDLGREVLAKLQLRGVAKVDVKRDLDGRLWLLEVNPRFNLWHNVGAAAGVNLPAFVAADLLGLPRPAPAVARPGVTWCWVEKDWQAARQAGTGVLPWLRWVAACDARAGLDPADPVPVAAKVFSLLGGRLRPGRPS